MVQKLSLQPAALVGEGVEGHFKNSPSDLTVDARVIKPFVMDNNRSAISSSLPQKSRLDGGSNMNQQGFCA